MLPDFSEIWSRKEISMSTRNPAFNADWIRPDFTSGSTGFIPPSCGSLMVSMSLS